MTETPDTSSQPKLSAAFGALSEAWRQQGALDGKTRRALLKKLKKELIQRRDGLAEAISSDFGNRAKIETLGAEIYLPVECIRHTLEHLDEWMEPLEREISWHLRPASGEIRYQPLGVVGIIAPWNYPLQLVMLPLIAAIAAGNRVLVKPSENVPKTAAAIEELLSAVFTPEQVQVVQGGIELGSAMASLPLDHLLFTGSTRVGRAVMQAAAANLTPVTLELGGKSPAIVHESFPIAKAAERIAYGKTYNAGQTCIAPDYVLCPENRVDALVEAIKQQTEAFYPSRADNDDFTTILNDQHYRRLMSMVDEAQQGGATVVEVNPAAEDADPEARRMSLHIITNATAGMAVLEDEIFGPILPIVPYKTLDEAIAYVNARPRPLALYYFDRNSKRVAQVLDTTTSGGACINDTLLHNSQESLPFGGVGPSGMGSYHGYQGFLTFSHAKSVLRQSRFAGTKLLNPPYNAVSENVFRVFIGR